VVPAKCRIPSVQLHEVTRRYRFQLPHQWKSYNEKASIAKLNDCIEVFWENRIRIKLRRSFDVSFGLLDAREVV